MLTLRKTSSADADASAPPAAAGSLPFNPNNKLMSPEALEKILATHGVTGAPPIDINVYRLAMVHKSYCTRKNENYLTGNVHCPPDVRVKLQESSNERLEFLGDAVLSLVVADYLYERFPDSDEGFLTTIRSKLVCGKSLSRLADIIGLAEWLVISKQIEDDNGRGNAKILEDTFEALLGAIFLDFGDFGFLRAKAFVTGVLERYIDFAQLVTSAQSTKDKFLRFYAARFGSMPSFGEIERAADGSEVEVSIRNRDGFVVAVGTGSNKKEAEADASVRALRYYGHDVADASFGL